MVFKKKSEPKKNMFVTSSTETPGTSGILSNTKYVILFLFLLFYASYLNYPTPPEDFYESEGFLLIYQITDNLALISIFMIISGLLIYLFYKEDKESIFSLIIIILGMCLYYYTINMNVIPQNSDLDFTIISDHKLDNSRIESSLYYYNGRIIFEVFIEAHNTSSINESTDIDNYNILLDGHLNDYSVIDGYSYDNGIYLIFGQDYQNSTYDNIEPYGKISIRLEHMNGSNFDNLEYETTIIYDNNKYECKSFCSLGEYAYYKTEDFRDSIGKDLTKIKGLTIPIINYPDFVAIKINNKGEFNTFLNLYRKSDIIISNLLLAIIAGLILTLFVNTKGILYHYRTSKSILQIFFKKYLKLIIGSILLFIIIDIIFTTCFDMPFSLIVSLSNAMFFVLFYLLFKNIDYFTTRIEQSLMILLILFGLINFLFLGIRTGFLGISMETYEIIGDITYYQMSPYYWFGLYIKTLLNRFIFVFIVFLLYNYFKMKK